ncbi:response regulator transcription factor [Yinghuangia seranimata]|uniref:response regulator transcription factor n=1 Tax=Yinghuangia seranimata TaxID=408067 RepID=UPI00248C02FF|nr:response regulator transcription factor [Yinghuangia seranimata]MDI2124883.1 response regulator transcription factor [Yinghuangia seranimata]
MKVLIVEDEEEMAELLSDGLRRQGFSVDVARDGARALECAAASAYDVVVLDRDLPVLHGDAVCRTLVATRNGARILMLTASGALADRVDGLNLGADDYLAKPFAYTELVARIHALARRGGGTAVATVLERHGVVLDTQRHLAERDGRLLRLSPKEMLILELLLAADGGVVTHADLLDEAWEEAVDPRSSVVKVAIHGLRRKLGDPPLIEAVPGIGYRL